MEALKRISLTKSSKKIVEAVPIPEVTHGSVRKVLRGEDFLVAETSRPWPGSNPVEAQAGPPSTRPSVSRAPEAVEGERVVSSTFSVFAVFDGHNGPAVARLASEKIAELVEERLPWGRVPDPLDDRSAAWRAALQRALAEALIEVDFLFSSLGVSAGSTATVVLLVDWLATVASIGDSRAMVDTGAAAAALTIDDRLASNQAERRRVEAVGAKVAPIDLSGKGPAKDPGSGMGPLRVWPGGLCLSRALGDFDVGRAVIAYPHIRQVILPPTGARLVLASDGLWDAFEGVSRVAALARTWPTAAAPGRLVDHITTGYGGIRDDTSVIVVDVCPPAYDFRQLAAAFATSKFGKAGHDDPPSCGCFGCGGSKSGDVGPDGLSSSITGLDPSVKPLIRLLADVDVAELLQLTPNPQPPSAPWFSEAVGASLLQVANEAATTWRTVAIAKHRGRTFSTPDHSTHWSRSGRTSGRAATVADLSGHSSQLALEATEAARAKAAASAPVPSPADARVGSPTSSDGDGTSLRRRPSQYFHDAVAVDDADYARQFGKYKETARDEDEAAGAPDGSGDLDDATGDGSAGSSSEEVAGHGGRGITLDTFDARQKLDAAAGRGGSSTLPSRADPSVRVNRYSRANSDPSVRAGGGSGRTPSGTSLGLGADLSTRAGGSVVSDDNSDELADLRPAGGPLPIPEPLPEDDGGFLDALDSYEAGPAVEDPDAAPLRPRGALDAERDVNPRVRSGSSATPSAHVSAAAAAAAGAAAELLQPVRTVPRRRVAFSPESVASPPAPLPHDLPNIAESPVSRASDATARDPKERATEAPPAPASAAIDP